MNTLWSWMETNMLSLAVLEVLIKVTLVLGVVAVISLVTHVTAASKRLLWSAAIVIALLVPFSSVLLPAIEVPLPSQQQTPAPIQQRSTSPSEISRPAAELTLGNAVQMAIAENNTQSSSAVVSTQPSNFWFTWKTALTMTALFWFLGLAYFTTKLWRQHRHVQAIKENARSFSDNNTIALGAHHSSVSLLISDDIATPIAVGVLKPVIILPDDAQTWDAEKLRSAIAHEMAHVKGRDNLVRACAGLLCALYWFHPLAWYSARKLHEEQEKAADNAVINQGVSASTYARNLLDIVKSLQGNINSYENTVSASMASYSFFPQRMRSILSDSQSRQGISLGKAIVMVTGFFALALPVTLLTTQVGRAQNDEQEPIRYIDFAQNTITDSNPQPTPEPAPSPRPVSDSEQIFHDLDAQMTAAFNEKDLDTLLSLYTEDAKVSVDGDFNRDIYRGKREIKKYWDDLLDTDMTIRTQVQSVNREGNQAQVKVRYWSSFDTEIGKLNDFFGGETTTDWQLVDGRWRIVNDVIHEPDYVNDESIERIVGAALKPLEEMDWEGFGESIGEAMEAWGEGIAINFENAFNDWDKDWNWDASDSNNPLINAVKSGNSKTVKVLLENGADANASAGWGRSALYMAVNMGNEDMVKQLLQHGADVDITTRSGESALFVAAKHGHLDIVKRLMDYGADANQPARSGRTPLSVAARAGHDKVVEYLIEHGAKVGV